jgi:DNA polymerase III epsilon subunit-like protein
MRNAELCTVQLARRVMPDLEKHHLDALAAHFGFQITGRHRAAGDARATARVLLHLIDELSLNGVSSLGEARKFRARVEAHRDDRQHELALTFDS